MKLQTAVECDCKVCSGGTDTFVCTCFCHAESLRSRKASGFFNMLGAMNSEMEKAEQLTDEELTTQFAESIGNEERIDSYKCSLIGELLHRFQKYSKEKGVGGG